MMTPSLLQPLPIPQASFTDIHMDFIEGFRKSWGKNVIFVVDDRFSKYAYFMALIHPYTASSVAKVFMDNVFKQHGFLATIVSDRDLVFLSQLWKNLFIQQEVYISTLLYSLPPQSDGRVM
jgi:hypothetical protein